MLLRGAESSKVQEHLRLLDDARSNGQWRAVPEILRKLEKHASHRKSLIYTARYEYASISRDGKPDIQSRNAADQRVDCSGTADIGHLEALVREEKELNKEDDLQARACLAGLHNLAANPAAVIRTLNDDLEQILTGSATEKGHVQSNWTLVALIQSARLKGKAYQELGQLDLALKLYQSTAPLIEKIGSSPIGQLSGIHSAVELYLIDHCLFFDTRQTIKSVNKQLASDPSLGPSQALQALRQWSAHCGQEYSYASARRRYSGSEDLDKHYRIWKLYYQILSRLLHNEESVQSCGGFSKIYPEFRSVQSILEDFVLANNDFPRAGQSTPDVLEWIDAVMSNWARLHGSSWSLQSTVLDHDQKSLSRDVLGILYRGAQKTFHSSSILRYLSIVHYDLSEFEISSKALEIYVQIIEKGRLRMAKSANSDPDLDGKVIYVRAVADGIIRLCALQRDIYTEQAAAMAHTLMSWVGEGDIESRTNIDSTALTANPDDTSKFANLAPQLHWQRALSRAHFANGICKALRARTTFDSESRYSLQESAVSDMRKSIRVDAAAEDDVEILFGLARVLAESRDHTGAITTIKHALGILRGSKASPTFQGDSPERTKQHGLRIACWHLLILLLTGRGEHELALTSCEAALEPYNGIQMLQGTASPSAVISSMHYLEKRSLIALCTTYITILEAHQGLESALKKMQGLLIVYAEVFQEESSSAEQPCEYLPRTASTTTLKQHLAASHGNRKITPSSSTSTHPRRSRLFSGLVSSMSSTSLAENSGGPINGPAGSGWTSGHEAEALPQNPTHHQAYLGRHESKRLRKRPSQKSLLDANGVQQHDKTSQVADSDHGRHRMRLPHLPHLHLNKHETIAPSSISSESNAAISKETIEPDTNTIGVAMTHNMPSYAPASSEKRQDLDPAENQNLPAANMMLNGDSDKSETLSTTNQCSETSILVQCPASLKHRHANMILLDIWLFIASLYRSADMLLDADGAIVEAHRLLEQIEGSIHACKGASAASFAQPDAMGWKSFDMLQADILVEEALLQLQRGLTQQAAEKYEAALLYSPDHVDASVGLANILLDFSNTNTSTDHAPSLHPPADFDLPGPPLAPLTHEVSDSEQVKEELGAPETRAARDRCYSLLSMITSSGQGWDHSEAWMALACACEMSGEVDKAREALWWVVELEDGRPLRAWHHIAWP